MGQVSTAAAAVATEMTIYQQFLRGADIASSGTIALGIEDYFHVTGTTQINFLSTTGLLDGKQFTLYFSAVLLLAHNAASPPAGSVRFVLSDGINIVTAAGDTATFRYDAAANAAVQVAGIGLAPVLSVSAGTGISITGTSTAPVINNTGVLSVAPGLGISITGTAQNPVVNNTGVLSLIPGTGISITGGGGGNPTISNTGVLSVSAGVAISITGTTQSPVVNNNGVTSVNAGPGINIQGTPNNPIVQAKVIGSVKLGGFLGGAGTGAQWFPDGINNVASFDVIEWPINQFTDAGATTLRYVGFLNSLLGAGCDIYLTCNGTMIAGTLFTYSFANVGIVFDATVSIPAAPTVGPRTGSRAIGLGINGRGATNIEFFAMVSFQ